MLILCFLLFLVNRNEMISHEKTVFFKVTIYRMKSVVLLEMVTILCEDSALASVRVIHVISNVLGFSITPIVSILMAVTFNQRIAKKIRILIWPVIIYIILCIQSAYSGIIFFVTLEYKNYIFSRMKEPVWAIPMTGSFFV